MKITTLKAIALRSIKPGVFDAISPFGMAEAVMARYDFKKGPTADELARPEIDEVQFYFGRFGVGDLAIPIEQFSIRRAPDDLSIWIGAMTKTTTDASDEFLADVLGWAEQQYQIDTSEVLPVRFQNQCEIVLVRPLSHWLECVRPINEALSGMLCSYGFGTLDFDVSSIKFRTDDTQPTSSYLNSEFKFERRANRPYAESCYFSLAPLRTSDHEQLIALVARLFAS